MREAGPVSGTEAATATDAVRALTEATGAAWELRRRLVGGETGAHEIARSDGTPFVLKWDTDPTSQRARRRGARLTERLRVEAGWPVPDQRVVEHDGWLLVVQDLVPGEPVTHLSNALVDRLLRLHRQRLPLTDAGIAEEAAEGPDAGWPGALIRTLTVGGPGYCRHESLRTYDERTAHLLDVIVDIGRSLDPADLPGDGIVHWDLHPGNLLQVQGVLTAVIDNDFVTIGDPVFDLVTLALGSRTARCDPGVRDRLDHEAFDGLSETQRRAYVAHLLLRIIDWPIRRHDAHEVEFWLARADELLLT